MASYSYNDGCRNKTKFKSLCSAFWNSETSAKTEEAEIHRVKGWNRHMLWSWITTETVWCAWPPCTAVTHQSAYWCKELQFFKDRFPNHDTKEMDKIDTIKDPYL